MGSDPVTSTQTTDAQVIEQEAGRVAEGGKRLL
jgi:hypothetical protein